MNTQQAYDLVLSTVRELARSGVTVESTKPTVEEIEQLKKEDPDLLISELPVDKWINIHFYFSNKILSEKIYEMATYLNLAGIQFDSGGTSLTRDWNLDWSFKNSGREDTELRDNRKQVEQLLNEQDI